MSRYVMQELDGHAAARARLGKLPAAGPACAALHDPETAEWRSMEEGAAPVRWRPKTDWRAAADQCWQWSMGIPRMRVIEEETGRILWDSAGGAPSRPREEVCQPCRVGNHGECHRGIWTRADGSDPVVCPCQHQAPTASGQLALEL